MQNKLKISTSAYLIAGFGIVLLSMVGLLGLNIQHIFYMQEREVREQDLHNKSSVVYQMREAIRNRSVSLIRVATMKDFFDRDDERQRFNLYASDFVIGMEKISSYGLSYEERKALQLIRREIKLAQPIVENAMDMAVDSEWTPHLQQTIIDALDTNAKVRKSLTVFIEFVGVSSEVEHRRHLNHQQHQIVITGALGVAALVFSFLISIFVVRREMKHKGVLRDHAEDSEARY